VRPLGGWNENRARPGQTQTLSASLFEKILKKKKEKKEKDKNQREGLATHGPPGGGSSTDQVAVPPVFKKFSRRACFRSVNEKKNQKDSRGALQYWGGNKQIVF